MICDVGKATDGLQNELWRGWSDGKSGEWAELNNIIVHNPVEEIIMVMESKYTYKKFSPRKV